MAAETIFPKIPIISESIFYESNIFEKNVLQNQDGDFIFGVWAPKLLN
jgi:hypothetical protein